MVRDIDCFPPAICMYALWKSYVKHGVIIFSPLILIVARYANISIFPESWVYAETVSANRGMGDGYLQRLIFPSSQHA
jgi:hypothetical protein